MPELTLNSAKGFTMPFGKHKGCTMVTLLQTHYHYAKWLLNQPLSKNPNFEKVRMYLNFLLEDDAFISELADTLPDTAPDHKHGKVQVKVYESEGKDYDSGPTPKYKPVYHTEADENDGIDFLLVSRIDPINHFCFEHEKDQTLFNNFMGKYEQDGDDTLLILQRINGYIVLLNYKFVEKIVANEGECDFLWQS